MKPCLVCGALSEGSRCPDHPARKAWQSTTTSRQARGYDYAWLRLRAAVLAEYPTCQVCGAEPSTQADHIVPLAEGGARLDRRNIQALGVVCHTAKTDREKLRSRRGNDVR